MLQEASTVPPSLLVALSDVIAEGKYTENEGREGRVSFLPFHVPSFLSPPSLPVHLLELNSLAGRGHVRTNSEGGCRWQ